MTSLRSRFTSASWKGKQRASPSDSDSYSKEQERGYRDVGRGGRVGRRDGLSGVEGDGGEDGIVLPLDMVGGGFYEACVHFPYSITFLLFSLYFFLVFFVFVFLGSLSCVCALLRFKARRSLCAPSCPGPIRRAPPVALILSCHQRPYLARLFHGLPTSSRSSDNLHMPSTRERQSSS